MTLRAMTLTVALAVVTVAHAGDGMTRYKNYLPSQIKALPEKERSSSVPMAYTEAAQLASSAVGDLLFQSQLNALMYSGLADYDEAKRAFQSDLGDKPTGNLTVGQIHKLGYRAQRLKLTEVSFFPMTYRGYITEDYASVVGTLKILDEKIAYPINHVTIECYKSESYCRYRQIALTLPHENDFTQTYYVGEMANEIFKVTRWEGNQIDAAPVQALGCRISRLSFNFETKEFYEIATNNSGASCNSDSAFDLPKLEKPRVSQIVDGTPIVAEEFRKIRSETSGYYSTEFMKRVKAMTAAEKPSAN